MKMLIIIVKDDDAFTVVDELNEKTFMLRNWLVPGVF